MAYEIVRLTKPQQGVYLPPPKGHEVLEDGSLAHVYHETPGDVASLVDIDFNSNALAQPKDDFKAEANRLS